MWALINQKILVEISTIQLTHWGWEKMRQDGCHFTNILNCIFLNEDIWIPIKISLKFVPKSPISNIPPLVQIMAWCCPGNKTLSETMMVSLPMHICVTWPQWVNWILARWQIIYIYVYRSYKLPNNSLYKSWLYYYPVRSGLVNKIGKY